MIIPVIGLITLAGVLLALCWWSYRTVRSLWRRGTSEWGRLVYDLGVRGFGAFMGVFLFVGSAYVGAMVLATSKEDRIGCAVAGAIVGAILGTPVGLGMGYFWGTTMAAFLGLEPDSMNPNKQ
jgi:hypothetical protein